MTHSSKRNRFALSALLCAALISIIAFAQIERARAGQTEPAASAAPATAAAETQSASAQSGDSRSDDPVARIRDEGLNRSQVMATLSYLSDVIGPRLTGSPNLKRANEWTRQTLGSWGLVNAHLEAWGPFGRGWSLKRFSIQVTEPQTIVLNAYPRAWSPGFGKPIEADVVFLDAANDAE